ncbi:MAG: hypothetical protein J6Q94_02080 [Clostridia bacterium]|nr:hypothetical protein [Clostridia bacterium]
MYCCLAPFPLYDLATLLESKDIYFNSNMQELSGLDLCSHDAITDVRMMAEVWIKLFCVKIKQKNGGCKKQPKKKTDYKLTER